MSNTLSPTGLISPTVNDETNQTIADLAANFAMINKFYPVGTIYQSTKPTNPSTFLGGIWTRITDRVLVGAGSTFAAGETGGSAGVNIGSAAWGYQRHQGASSAGEIYGVHDHSEATNKKQNMPPYKAVYMWERTA